MRLALCVHTSYIISLFADATSDKLMVHRHSVQYISHNALLRRAIQSRGRAAGHRLLLLTYRFPMKTWMTTADCPHFHESAKSALRPYWSWATTTPAATSPDVCHETTSVGEKDSFGWRSLWTDDDQRCLSSGRAVADKAAAVGCSTPASQCRESVLKRAK